MRGEQIAVLVGSEKIDYTLPKDLLVNKGSDFFKSALTKDFTEARSGVLALPDEDPRAFELFVNYLSLDAVPAIPVAKEHGSFTFERMEREGMVQHEEPWHMLIRMGNKFLVGGVRSMALDCIAAFHKETETVCHPRLLHDDYLAWGAFDVATDNALSAYFAEEFASIRDAPRDQYGFFVDYVTLHLPKLMAGVLKAQHNEKFYPTRNKQN